MSEGREGRSARAGTLTGLGPKNGGSDGFERSHYSSKKEDSVHSERSSNSEGREFTDTVRHYYSKDNECFVATAVYGGENNHPNVEKLRLFRDNKLSFYFLGRKFTRFYYGGFGFRVAIFLQKHFPWTLRIFRIIFDLIIPLLPVNLIREEKTIPQSLFKMDFVKFCSSCAEFLKKEAKERKADCLCVGLSGGIDSAVALSICKLTGMKVIAVTISGKVIRKEDVEDARDIASHLDIEHRVIDLTHVFDSIISQDLPGKDHLVMGVRNTVVKEIAEDANALLVGSGVKTEGFAGLFAPNSILGSVFPLADIFKTQAYQLGKYFDLPECVLNKYSHSGIEGEENDSFFDLGYELFDWACLLMEKGKSDEEIEKETGILKHVIRAIRKQKEMTDKFFSFPNFKMK